MRIRCRWSWRLEGFRPDIRWWTYPFASRRGVVDSSRCTLGPEKREKELKIKMRIRCVGPSRACVNTGPFRRHSLLYLPYPVIISRAANVYCCRQGLGTRRSLTTCTRASVYYSCSSGSVLVFDQRDEQQNTARPPSRTSRSARMAYALGDMIERRQSGGSRAEGGGGGWLTRVIGCSRLPHHDDR